MNFFSETVRKVRKQYNHWHHWQRLVSQAENLAPHTVLWRYSGTEGVTGWPKSQAEDISCVGIIKLLVTDDVTDYAVSVNFIHLPINFSWFITFCQLKPKIWLSLTTAFVFKITKILICLLWINLEQYEPAPTAGECLLRGETSRHQYCCARPAHLDRGNNIIYFLDSPRVSHLHF